MFNNFRAGRVLALVIAVLLATLAVVSIVLAMSGVSVVLAETQSPVLFLSGPEEAVVGTLKEYRVVVSDSRPGLIVAVYGAGAQGEFRLWDIEPGPNNSASIAEDGVFGLWFIDASGDTQVALVHGSALEGIYPFQVDLYEGSDLLASAVMTTTWIEPFWVTASVPITQRINSTAFPLIRGYGGGEGGEVIYRLYDPSLEEEPECESRLFSLSVITHTGGGWVTQGGHCREPAYQFAGVVGASGPVTFVIAQEALNQNAPVYTDTFTWEATADNGVGEIQIVSGTTELVFVPVTGSLDVEVEEPYQPVAGRKERVVFHLSYTPDRSAWWSSHLGPGEWVDVDLECSASHGQVETFPWGVCFWDESPGSTASSVVITAELVAQTSGQRVLIWNAGLSKVVPRLSQEGEIILDFQEPPQPIRALWTAVDLALFSSDDPGVFTDSLGLHFTPGWGWATQPLAGLTRWQDRGETLAITSTWTCSGPISFGPWGEAWAQVWRVDNMWAWQAEWDSSVFEDSCPGTLKLESLLEERGPQRLLLLQEYSYEAQVGINNLVSGSLVLTDLQFGVIDPLPEIRILSPTGTVPILPPILFGVDIYDWDTVVSASLSLRRDVPGVGLTEIWSAAQVPTGVLSFTLETLPFGTLLVPLARYEFVWRVWDGGSGEPWDGRTVQATGYFTVAGAEGFWVFLPFVARNATPPRLTPGPSSN